MGFLVLRLHEWVVYLAGVLGNWWGVRTAMIFYFERLRDQGRESVENFNLFSIAIATSQPNMRQKHHDPSRTSWLLWITMMVGVKSEESSHQRTLA